MTCAQPAPPTADVPTADSTAAVGNRRPSGSPVGGSGTPVAGGRRTPSVTGASRPYRTAPFGADRDPLTGAHNPETDVRDPLTGEWHTRVRRG